MKYLQIPMSDAPPLQQLPRHRYGRKLRRFSFVAFIAAGLPGLLSAHANPRATVSVTQVTASSSSIVLNTPHGRFEALVEAPFFSNGTRTFYVATSMRRRLGRTVVRGALIARGDEVIVYFRDHRTAKLQRTTFPRFQPLHRHPMTLSRARGEVGRTDTLGTAIVSKSTSQTKALANGNVVVPRRTLRVGVDIDNEFAEYFGTESSAAVREVVFATTTLYAQQLGIELVLTSIGSPELGPVEYATSTEAPTLLNQFREFTLQHRHLGPADAFILMSGKILRGSFIGISYQDSACFEGGSYAFGLTQRVRPVLQPILLAHELAHILGAKHDDTSKASIMNTFVSAEDTSFSSLSAQQVSNYIAKNGSCLAVSSAPGVSLAGKLKSSTLSLTVSLSNVDPSTCSLTLVGAATKQRLTTQKVLSGGIPITIREPGSGFVQKVQVEIVASNVPALKREQNAFLGVQASCATSAGATSSQFASAALPLKIPGQKDRLLRRVAPSTVAEWITALASAN